MVTPGNCSDSDPTFACSLPQSSEYGDADTMPATSAL